MFRIRTLLDIDSASRCQPDAVACLLMHLRKQWFVIQERNDHRSTWLKCMGPANKAMIFERSRQRKWFIRFDDEIDRPTLFRHSVNRSEELNDGFTVAFSKGGSSGNVAHRDWSTRLEENLSHGARMLDIGKRNPLDFPTMPGFERSP